MRAEYANIDEEKRRVIQELSSEYDVRVVILSGLVRKLTYPVHRGGAYISLPFITPFIVLSLDFLQDLPVKSVEHLMLHEIGHKVLYEMDHEEFAEKFALKNFTGTKEEYHEAWSSKMYYEKTSQPLTEMDVGDEFL